EVVDAQPGQGFPVQELARALARALRRDGPALASSLPVLRDAVEARRAVEGTVAAGAIAILAKAGNAPHLPVISQSQMLSDITTTHGAEPPESPRATATTVAPPLVASLVTSALSRRLVQRLPVRYRRSRLVEAAVAVGASIGLAAIFRRLGRQPGRTGPAPTALLAFVSSGRSGQPLRRFSHSSRRAGEVRPLRRSSASVS
ncbi:MAG: hypothetical protein H0W16_00285, partial [Actinobacteria bacterium]|nr:hypothetical protein [Actinomycetota bacterium]